MTITLRFERKLSFVTASDEVSQRKKMLYPGTDSESHIAEYTLIRRKNDHGPESESESKGLSGGESEGEAGGQW